jgi:F-type H+-transporting ATPase subunit b
MAETTTETTAEGQAHGTEGTEAHGGVFPPLNTQTYPSQLFWLAIFFGALYFLMSRLVLPRIAAILDARRARIEGDLARAQALKDETEAAVKSYEKALADARSRASDIARETRDIVNKDVDAAQSAADAELAKKISAAETRIAKGRDTAMKSVAAIAAESAADIVAALGGGKVAKATAAKAVSIKG